MDSKRPRVAALPMLQDSRGSSHDEDRRDGWTATSAGPPRNSDPGADARLESSPPGLSPPPSLAPTVLQLMPRGCSPYSSVNSRASSRNPSQHRSLVRSSPQRAAIHARLSSDRDEDKLGIPK